MKKYDIEYSTQYFPEMIFLQERGINPSFVKSVDNVVTYKYKKNVNLFKALVDFYQRYESM